MKRTIKINFTDFWYPFNKTNNYFWNLLSKKYDLELSEEPDILFYSDFGINFTNYNCIRVFFTGENTRPNFKECDFSFSFDYLPEEPRNYRLPLYLFYDDVNKLTISKEPELIASKKTKFCSFIISNKYSAKRINFFKKLSKYKKVDSGGKVLNNIGDPVKDKYKFMKDYKFNIAFENSAYPGYTTEKIFQPMQVNTIPIYWGNPLIYKDFNTKSFINCHDYKNDKEVIERIIEIDNNRDLYINMLSQPYLNNNEITDFVKEENIVRQLDYIINTLPNIEPVARRFKPKSIFSIKLKKKMINIKNKIKYYLNWN